MGDTPPSSKALQSAEQTTDPEKSSAFAETAEARGEMFSHIPEDILLRSAVSRSQSLCHWSGLNILKEKFSRGLILESVSFSLDLGSFCSWCGPSCFSEETKWPGLEASSAKEKGFMQPEGGSQAFVCCHKLCIDSTFWDNCWPGGYLWGLMVFIIFSTSNALYLYF